MKNDDSVKAVFFDMGGTLEEVRYDKELRLNATGSHQADGTQGRLHK